MGLFGKKSREPIVGLYGKHPTADDFLRLNAASPGVRALDEWLSSSLAAAQRLIPDWESVYPSASTVFFLFCSRADKTPSALIGGLAPSRDRIGRQYPLIIFSELIVDSLIKVYQLIPFTQFMQDIASLLSCRNRLNRDQLFQTVQKLSSPDGKSFQLAHQKQQSYFCGTGCHSTFSSMVNPNKARFNAAPVQMLRDVCQSISLTRPLPNFGVRCPLGNRSTDNASLWMSLLHHHTPRGILPNVLWSYENATQLIYWNKVSAKALAALWWPGWQDDSLYDLANCPSSANEKFFKDGERLIDLFQ